MADKPSFLLYGSDATKALDDELEQRHDAGNPLALYKVLADCSEQERPLPLWATEFLQNLWVDAVKNGWVKGAVGNRNSILGRYGQYLSPRIVVRVYASIMHWMKDPHTYRRMPTSVIIKWYSLEISHEPKSAERAIDLTHKALIGTPAETKNRSTLERQIYDDPVKDDEFRDVLDGDYWYGEMEAEVLLGLRPPGQFWGPPGDPPPEINKILDQHPKKENRTPITPD